MNDSVEAVEVIAQKIVAGESFTDDDCVRVAEAYLGLFAWAVANAAPDGRACSSNDVGRRPVSDNEDTFPIADIFTRPTDFAAWQARGRRKAKRDAEVHGERLAAEERAYAARRRAEGLPPVVPVHPEVVPELVAEFEEFEGMTVEGDTEAPS